MLQDTNYKLQELHDGFGTWNHVVNMVQPPPPIPLLAKTDAPGDFLTLLDSGHKTVGSDGDMWLATSFGNDCHYSFSLLLGVKIMRNKL
jgi:hypothetical protein